MATVDIPLGAFNRRSLPPVCPVTGATEDLTWRAVEFSWYPRWVNLLALPALLIAAILATLLTRRANGELPFGKGVWLRWQLGRFAFGLAVVAAIVVIIVAIAAMTSGDTSIGLGAIAGSIAVPLGVWFAAVRNRGVGVVEINDAIIRLSLPSEAAALAYRQRLAEGFTAISPTAAQAIERLAAATRAAPEGAICAVHPDTQARWSCGRCGSFFCPRCAQAPSGGNPICAACFAGQAAAKAGSALGPGYQRQVWSGVATAALSLVPMCWLAILLSLVLNGGALFRVLRVPADERPKTWWIPLAALGVTLASVAFWVVMGARRMP